MALNIAEGLGYGRGRRQKHHFQIALGSARESMTCIELAIATGLLDERDADVAAVVDPVDHIYAMLWKLTRHRAP